MNNEGESLKNASFTLPHTFFLPYYDPHKTCERVKYEIVRTFLFVLQDCVGIKPHHEGLDFYFATESNAKKLVEFFSSMIPIR